jgi:hypothetical protein
MHKYGETKTTRIMMANVRHVTSSFGLRKFQAILFFVEQSVPCIVIQLLQLKTKY